MRRAPSPRTGQSRDDYDGAVSNVVLIALIVFGVSIVGGLAVGGAEGLGAWRAFRRFQRTTERGRCSESPRRSARSRSAPRGVDERVARLERAQASLQETLRTAGVLAGAAGEAFALVPARAQIHARQVTRVAAVDLGTNSTRLLVADVDGERGRRGRPPLGGDAARRGRRRVAAAAARARSSASSRRSRATGDELEALGAERALAVATSAVRDAANGAEFLAEVEASVRLRDAAALPATRRPTLTRRGVGALDATHARRRRRRRLDRADPRRRGGRASTSARCG